MQEERLTLFSLRDGETATSDRQLISISCTIITRTSESDLNQYSSCFVRLMWVLIIKLIIIFM